MKNQKIIFTIIFLTITALGFAQEDNDYVEFNDRNNIVHGVYLGISLMHGEINKQDSYRGEIKVAYVANQQFEVGFAANFIYSEQDLLIPSSGRIEDLIGIFGGLHLEPIFFSKSRVNLSFPLLIGGGAVSYIGDAFIGEDNRETLTEDDFDAVFIVEPGLNVLFNVSRYLQLEAGIKYLFSSKIELEPATVNRLNGFSAGIGIKVGIFNMGRNRYKKNIGDAN